MKIFILLFFSYDVKNELVSLWTNNIIWYIFIGYIGETKWFLIQRNYVYWSIHWLFILLLYYNNAISLTQSSTCQKGSYNYKTLLLPVKKSVNLPFRERYYYYFSRTMIMCCRCLHKRKSRCSRTKL